MSDGELGRRDFLKTTVGTLGAGALASGTTGAHAADDGLDHRNERADRMHYRQLGRTKFMSSQLVFGCGSALVGGKAVHLLERAYEAGVNYFDIGSNDYYKGAEKHLAAFAKKRRGDIWITSKGYARSSVEHTPGTDVSVEYAKVAAKFWTRLVEQSLIDLDSDTIDAYFTQGANDPSLVRSEEMGRAFENVKASGKVGHVGVSTHQNAQAVLATAVETGWYDIAMVAVNPAGWYDWKNKAMLAGTPSLKALRPELDRVRESGMGVIGMKAGRLIAPLRAGGQGDTAAFDSFYDEKLMAASYTPHQRSYAFVLAHGLDAVNADMQNFKHFEENLGAVRDGHTYFA